MQLFDTDLCESLFQPSADRGVRGGKRPVVEQRLDVEHRTADDHGHRAAPNDRLDARCRAALVARDGSGLGDIQDVQLVVGDATALFDGQLRGADVHAAVELHRVCVHDLAANSFRDCERQLGLARACGPDDRDRPGHVVDSRVVPPSFGLDMPPTRQPSGSQTPAKYPTPNGAPRYSSFTERGVAPASPASTCHATRPVIDGGSRLSAATSPAASASSRVDWTATDAESCPPGARGVRVLTPSATTSTPTGSSVSSMADRSSVPRRIESSAL